MVTFHHVFEEVRVLAEEYGVDLEFDTIVSRYG